jgi:hypothetical protein
MKNVTILAVAMLLIGAGRPAVASGSAPGETGVAAGSVKVTVNYKGKGTVDASHQIWVWLFDSPNIGAGSMPVDQASLDTNGAAAVFENVVPGQVYVAVAFDESGTMTGDGPPPPGTPIALLMGGQGPAAITPGDKGVATITFDDSMRMQ